MTNQSGGGGSNPVLPYSEAVLGANVSSGISTAYGDVVTLTLASGSYLVGFILVGLSPSTSNNLLVQVTDGTAVYFGGRAVATAIDFYTLAGSRGIVLTASATLHLQAASSVASAWTIRASAQVAGTDKATLLTALKYA